MPEALRPELQPMLPDTAPQEDLRPNPETEPGTTPDRVPESDTGDAEIEADILHPDHPGVTEGVDLAPEERGGSNG